MKNMIPYDLKMPFEVYKDAVNRKNEWDEKQELLSIENLMADCYSDYEQHYNQNNLESMLPARVGIDHSEVLKGLYGSKTKLVKDFRNRYFVINPQTYYNLCPYCVINSANTTEHILPKQTFPEHSVNVNNLIPACGECNSLKGDDVLNDNGLKFILNYYTDILPDVQFLYVNIRNQDGNLLIQYYLSNPEGQIDANLFSLIGRHFDKLDLLKRYNDKAIQEFTEIKNSYLAGQFANEMQYNSFVEKQLRKCDLDVPAYGRNHWKIVLLRGCANSDVFKQYILAL